MKITGYTIIFLLLGILLLYLFILFEIDLYYNSYLSKNKIKQCDFYLTNTIVLIIIICTLQVFFRLFDKLDKLLKKRLL